MAVQRLIASADGLRISAGGSDARYVAEAVLPFSTTGRHLMQVGSGSFVLSEGVRVPFGVTVSGRPLVACGVAGDGRIGMPVDSLVDASGFYAWPRAMPDGSKPAAGQLCTWTAFMLSAV